MEFLLHCPHRSLEEYELSQLNEAANLRKQLRVVSDKLVECLAAAQVARCMIEHRHNLSRTVISVTAKEVRAQGMMIDAD